MYLEIILTLILLVMLSFPITIFILWIKFGKKITKNFKEVKDLLKQPKIEIPSMNQQKDDQNKSTSQIPDMSGMFEMMGKFGQLFGKK